MHRTIQIFLAVLLCPLLAAQESVVQSSPKPALPTNIANIPIRNCGENCIEFFLLEAVSSATAKKGQTIRLAVAEDFSVNGVVVIPKGTPVDGKVTSVRKGVFGRRDGWITVEAKSVVLDNGRRLRLRQYPPGEDSCGDFGPCWAFFLIMSPLIAIFLPFALLSRIDGQRHSVRAHPVGTPMTLQPCKRIDAYLSKKIAIQLSSLSAASTSSAAVPLGCGATN